MTIVVTPLHDLDAALARWRPAHLVSLGSPGGPTAAPPPEGVEWLPLTFHDIATPRDGLTLASTEQVDALIDLARRWDGVTPLLVQCWAGVSRSPAAAYVIACARAAPGSERDIAAALRHAAPFATPNAHVIALADALLDRNGAMIAAIATIGRGAEVSMGSTFVLTA